MKIYKLFIVVSILWLALYHQGYTQAAEGQPLTRMLTPATTTAAEAPSKTINNPQNQPLARFGYQLFSGRDAGAEFLGGGMLPADYRLGPGDVLTVFLGGKAQAQHQLAVSVDGQIYFPTVGVIFVENLTIPEFKTLLDQKLRRVYSSYTLDVMLSSPKQVSIAVIGEVIAPGNYVGSALSTVLDFVALAKGPSQLASLRDIQVFRGDSLISHVDLYDFLLRPAGYQSFTHQSGDKVFVPVVSSTIEVTGQVQRPAVYELNPHRSERVHDLLELAGGFNAIADRRKVALSRLLAGSERQIESLCLAEECWSNEAMNPILSDQDRVHVFSLEEQTPQDSVEIHGEVKKPGVYLYQKNMRVSDLLLQAGGLVRGAYALEAEVAKIDPANQVRTIKVNLLQILAGDETQDMTLQPDDHVFIRKTPGWRVGQLVRVNGEVKFPGMYAIVEDSTTFSQIIRDAGGFTEDALIREMRLIRERKTFVEDKEFIRLATMARSDMSNSEYEYFVMKQNNGDINEVVVDFYKLFVKNDATEDVLLKDGDVVYVPKRPNVVYVTGRVSNSGGILYKPGGNARYYIQKAGGFTWDADKSRAMVIKVNGEIKSMDSFKSLEAGDRIWVPRKKEVNYWQVFRDFVMVMGQLATVYLVVRTATR